jgi:hypothetical protein
MALCWVDESEVPKGRSGYGVRDTGPWADVMRELRANPNKWAVIADGDIDSSKVTSLRYRFPDIDFRCSVVSRTGGKPVKVWACYHGAAETEVAMVPLKTVADFLKNLAETLDK